MSILDPVVSSDPTEARRAVKIFRNHVDEMLPLLRDVRFTKIPQESDLFAIFFDWRRSPFTEFSLRNVMHFLGESWGLQIFVPEALGRWMQELTKDWHFVHTHVFPSSLILRGQNISDRVKKDIEFWRNLKGQQQLFFNSDSMLCRRNIEDFRMFDYIGAPWPSNVVSPWCRVGSGGFSLRRKAVMIEICETCNLHPLVIGPEDAFFSVNLHMTPGRYKVASSEIAQIFAVERIFHPFPLGINRPWKFLRSSEIAHILEHVSY
jgi:hypothetical protein